MARLVARSTIIYLTATNVGSAAMFAYDKHQANTGGWRISERELCTTALAGGWLGGLIAMHLFRHKTRKKSFQKKYVAAIGTNTIIAAPALAGLLRIPAARDQFRKSLNSFAHVISQRKGGRRKW